MNDEYLWNKTGTDAEIEELENALQAFRLQPSEPPPLPSIEKAMPERRIFGLFKFGFAVAFAAAAIAVVSAIWIRSPKVDRLSQDPVAKTAEQRHTPPHVQSGIVDPPIMEPRTPKPPVIVKAKQPTMTTRAIKVSAKKQEKLTPEEKHAYDQLMTALAITSNELKFVKDKVKGRDEERTAVPERQK